MDTWSKGKQMRKKRPLGHRQMQILVEAAGEVSRACPWITIDSDRRIVHSLVRRGLLGATQDLFGIMPLGCLAIRRNHPELARNAARGLRRNVTSGEVMPWQV